MIEINEAEEIKNELKSKYGYTALDKPENIKSMIEMNNRTEKVREEFLYKDARTEINSRRCYVN